MNSKLKMPLLVIGCLGLLVLGYMSVRRAVNGNADLSGNYRLWVANLSEPTQPSRYSEGGPQDPDSYPPITYALYAPFGMLPLWLTALIWYFINLGSTYYLIQVARRSVPEGSGFEEPMVPDRWTTPQGINSADQMSSLEIPEAELKPANITSRTLGKLSRLIGTDPSRISILAGLAVFPFWIGSILLGQVTLLAMALVVFSLRMATRRPILAGTCLAFATIMKVLPAVFLLQFLMHRNWKAAATFAGTMVFMVFGLGSAYFGPQVNLTFHARWLELAVKGPTDALPDPCHPQTLRSSIRYNNQSIEAVTARLLVTVPIHRQVGSVLVNVTSINAASWRVCQKAVSGVCVALILLTLICHHIATRRLLSPGARPHATQIQQGLLFDIIPLSALSLMQLFVSPVVWSHYYVWLYWPLLLIIVESQRKQWTASLLLMGWFVAIPCIGSVFLRSIGLHLGCCIAIAIWLVGYAWRHVPSTHRAQIIPPGSVVERYPQKCLT